MSDWLDSGGFIAVMFTVVFTLIGVVWRDNRQENNEDRERIRKRIEEEIKRIDKRIDEAEEHIHRVEVQQRKNMDTYIEKVAKIEQALGHLERRP